MFRILGAGRHAGGPSDHTESKVGTGATGEELAGTHGLGRRDEVSESDSRKARAISACNEFLKTQEIINSGPHMLWANSGFLYRI